MLSFYLNRGTVYPRMKDKDHALADYNRAIELEPCNSAFAGYRQPSAFVYHEQGGVRPRFRPTTTGAHRAPAALLPRLSVGRAQAQPEKGRCGPKALPDIEQALSLDPNSAFAHDARAHILAALGRRNEAIAEYKKALAIEPDLQESVQGLKRLSAAKP